MFFKPLSTNNTKVAFDSHTVYYVLYTLHRHCAILENCKISVTARSVTYHCLGTLQVCRDSSVGIVTRYGLDGPGTNPGWAKIFRNRPDRPWVTPNLLYKGVPSLSRG